MVYSINRMPVIVSVGSTNFKQQIKTLLILTFADPTLKTYMFCQAVVVHTFRPSTQEAEQVSLMFKASLRREFQDS